MSSTWRDVGKVTGLVLGGLVEAYTGVPTLKVGGELGEAAAGELEAAVDPSAAARARRAKQARAEARQENLPGPASWTQDAYTVRDITGRVLWLGWYDKAGTWHQLEQT